MQTRWIILIGVGLYAIFFCTLRESYSHWNNFSKLNPIEKRATFFSDGAFYYSFFDDLARAQSFQAGLTSITQNDRIEAPDTINALRKFPIFTEVSLASLYRALRTSKNEAIDFYVNGIYAIHALLIVLIFLICIRVTRSIGSSILAVTIYFFHTFLLGRALHPALRENISIVFFLFQVFFLIDLLYKKLNPRIAFILISFSTLFHLLTWQFAPFILLAELAVLIALYLFKQLDLKTLGSLVASIVLAVFLTSILRSGYSYEHVFQFARSQFLGLSDFHTRLYRCDPEFLGISLSHLSPIIFTLLLPTTLVSFSKMKHYEKDTRILFLFAFTAVLFTMSLFARRFLILPVPFCCILVGLLIKESYFHRVLLILNALSSAYWGGIKLKEIYSVKNWHPDRKSITIADWVNQNTPFNATFAANIPESASIRLLTGRKTTIHPYYENHEIRQRTEQIYDIYSKKSESKIFETLRNLKVDYLVVNETACHGYLAARCTAGDLFNDTKEPEERFCKKILGNKGPSSLRQVGKIGSTFIFQLRAEK